MAIAKASFLFRYFLMPLHIRRLARELDAIGLALETTADEKKARFARRASESLRNRKDTTPARRFLTIRLMSDPLLETAAGMQTKADRDRLEKRIGRARDIFSKL